MVKHNQKYKLTLCCGTSCYLMCGDRIDSLGELLNQKYGDQFEIKPSGCLGQCHKHNRSAMFANYLPPFAKLNDKIIPNATNENIIKFIDECIKI